MQRSRQLSRGLFVVRVRARHSFIALHLRPWRRNQTHHTFTTGG